MPALGILQCRVGASRCSIGDAIVAFFGDPHTKVVTEDAHAALATARKRFGFGAFERLQRAFDAHSLCPCAGPNTFG